MGSATQWVLILSGLAFVLGFVSLLCSKIYVVDKASTEATEVDLPLVGKMKTNYPALVFVVTGAALAFYALNQQSQFESTQQPVRWNIKGQLQQPGHDIADWRFGEIKLIDVGPDVQIRKDGEFEINLEIPAGKTFESVVQQVYYTARNGSGLLVPADALQAYQTDSSRSPLLTKTPTTRVYRPMMVSTIADAGATP